MVQAIVAEDDITIHLIWGKANPRDGPSLASHEAWVQELAGIYWHSDATIPAFTLHQVQNPPQFPKI